MPITPNQSIPYDRPQPCNRYPYNPSLFQQLNIIEQLRYGDSWPTVKSKILQYEHSTILDFQSLLQTHQSQPVLPFKISQREKGDGNQGIDQHSDFGQPLGLDRFDQCPDSSNRPYQIPNHLPHGSPSTGGISKGKGYYRMFNNNSTKQVQTDIIYRLQSRAGKKNINQERLQEKYRRIRQENNTSIEELRHELASQQTDAVAQGLRYFDERTEPCWKCSKTTHETEYCPHESACLICLSRNHDSKACSQKYLCTKCFRAGHRTEKCPFYHQKLYDYCAKCERDHLGMTSKSAYNQCYSLTKGKEDRKSLFPVEEFRNCRDIICIVCRKSGHLNCNS